MRPENRKQLQQIPTTQCWYNDTAPSYDGFVLQKCKFLFAPMNLVHAFLNRAK